MTGVEYKAKGGARIQLVDARGSTYSVAESAVHINLGSYKGKLVETADILKEYAAIMETEPTELGVDPGMFGHFRAGSRDDTPVTREHPPGGEGGAVQASRGRRGPNATPEVEEPLAVWLAGRRAPHAMSPSPSVVALPPSVVAGPPS